MTLQAQLTSSDLAQDLATASTVKNAEAAIERWLAALPRDAAATPAAVEAVARARTSWPPETVGIWRGTARADGGIGWVRDATLDDDNFWSTTERIGPKTGRRVVLVGESVARGAFLDPLMNCASALQAYLNDGRSGEAGVEVVDLARNGLTVPWLVDLATQAMALQPDVLVIFAGNNWLLQPSALDRQAIASMIDAGASWRDVGAAFRDAVRRQAANLLFALAETARAHHVRLLFVVPANNARDPRARSEWHDPLLSTADRARVEQQLARAEALLDDGDHAGAHAAAALDLDPLVNARALWIRGVCALALGDNAEAVRRFGEMDDARLYVPLLGLLPCGPTLSAAIRDAAAGERVACVDLHDVLLAARDGVPPGRELFLDQVHMTPLGIRLSMAAVANRVRSLLGMPPIPRMPRASGDSDPVEVDPRAGAQGHFIAALLHGGQEHGDLAAWHARAAIEHAPEMAPVMLSIVRMMVSQTPALYHRAFAEVVEAARRFPGLRLVLYRIPVAAAQPVNVELPRALAAAAEPVLPGAIEECERLLRQTALGEGQTISLLRYAMQRTDALPWAATEPCYVRSFNPRTTFRLRCGAARDLRLDITARAGRGRTGQGSATLRVNGELVHEWPIGDVWSSTSCAVPAALLRGDVNDIEIGWPDPGQTRADRVRTLAAAFRAGALDGIGFPTTIYPVYGDVFAFDARWTA